MHIRAQTIIKYKVNVKVDSNMFVNNHVENVDTLNRYLMCCMRLRINESDNSIVVLNFFFYVGLMAGVSIIYKVVKYPCGQWYLPFSIFQLLGHWNSWLPRVLNNYVLCVLVDQEPVNMKRLEP